MLLMFGMFMQINYYAFWIVIVKFDCLTEFDFIVIVKNQKSESDL